MVLLVHICEGCNEAFSQVVKLVPGETVAVDRPQGWSIETGEFCAVCENIYAEEQRRIAEDDRAHEEWSC